MWAREWEGGRRIRAEVYKEAAVIVTSECLTAGLYYLPPSGTFTTKHLLKVKEMSSSCSTFEEKVGREKTRSAPFSLTQIKSILFAKLSKLHP